MRPRDAHNRREEKIVRHGTTEKQMPQKRNISTRKRTAAGAVLGYLKKGINPCEPERYRLEERVCEKV